MKFSRKSLKTSRLLLAAALFSCATFAAMLLADAAPDWIQNIEAKSALEAVMYRVAPLPSGPITIRRPPAETVPAFAALIKQQPQAADLYSLKAMEEEAKLDFDSAEADWKLYLQQAAENDKGTAELSLADFYHRRHRPKDEIIALAAIGNMPSPAAEKFIGVTEQTAWRAFERSLNLIEMQALGRAAKEALFTAWIARYPQEPSLYARYFAILLKEKDFKATGNLVMQYRGKFPKDEVFPTKARALIAYRQGSVEQGLAVYDKAYQPLWPPELVKNYFDLLKETRNERKFLEQARAALVKNPDDLLAVTRIFYYYQQHANIAAAQQAFTEYRLHKEARKVSWTPEELYTLARLLEDVHMFPEASRYYYALYKSGEGDAQEKSVAGLSRILLTAPEQEIRFGSGNLSMYQDIANMDPGPGYLNGILSLILNTTEPAQSYSEEEQRAVPFFHRARAAELVALFDRRFPNAESRADLHVQLIQAYAGYGLDEPVVRTGREFLAAFPSSSQRNQIALLMADAYQRMGDTKQEFAIYDAMLQELARKADGVPIGQSSSDARGYQPGSYQSQPDAVSLEGDLDEVDGEGSAPQQKRGNSRAAFELSKDAPAQRSGPRSPEYQQVLDRYISRLVAAKQIPAALAVWRQELDRNTNDPGLYERFAGFLESNRLGTEEEAVYRRAIQQFQGKDWYDKLARWYLQTERNQEFEALSKEVMKTFSGTEFAAYLGQAGMMPRGLDLQFNQFAHQKFPHNLTFVHRLLEFYDSGRFHNPVAWEALLRQYWAEDEGLRNQLFAYLSHYGKLEAELEQIRAAKTGDIADRRFVGEAELWRSHFESAAPILAGVAHQYPADRTLNHNAASVYRSLAYFDPKATDVAVQLESNLLKSAPADRDQLARIGDIYSDRELFNKAAPYWNQMADTEPGNPQSFQDAATVYWDYYFFDDALRLLNQGRTRLNDPSLYGYQVGAIYENKRDYPHAVAEYLQAALMEGEGGQSRTRLLQLAARKSTRDLVEAATSKAVADRKYDLDSIQLRVAALEAQQRNKEVTPFLNAALDQTNIIDVIESIETMAKDKSLEAVRQHALEREAAVSVDPVRRLELRYELVHFYEEKKDLNSAQQNIEALYRDNPKILGVVRSTVDFYSHNKLQSRAIEVLLQSAKSAYPALKTQFDYEAARKMTDAGQYQQARTILSALLNDNPNNSEYIAAIADTYARAAEQAGLRDFYTAQIKYVQRAQLTMSSDDRKTRLASLRRGLIPALTILKDYAGAIDQYIEIINAFPDDAGVTSEAAFYAQRYQRKDQLSNFYAKTVVASPKDSRWAVVLARVQTSYEDFDAAIKTYSDAIKIRPDRADLLTARAALEERLMRFDQAADDYRALYDLAYHDPKWMEKVAEIRARQSKNELAVQALLVALVDGRPELPGKYFTVADRLEGWGMIAEAREYAERGVKAAGNELLADSNNHSGARTYIRLMTELRQNQAAYQKLEQALSAASRLPSLTQQTAKSNIEAASNAELRENLFKTRRSAARTGFASCTREMGSTIARYFTPEGKLATAKWVDAKNAALSRDDAHEFLLPLAERAGFVDLQVRLDVERMQDVQNFYPAAQSLEQLQLRRLKLAELGAQFEEAATGTRSNYLNRAQNAFQLANRPVDELRVMETMQARLALPGNLQDRYFTLLLSQNVARLMELTRRDNMRDAATNFLIAHGSNAQAFAGIATRSHAEAAVWKPAYSALAGLYFKDASASVGSAFETALGDGTIGQHLDKKITRDQTLAGDVWYYYGSRYGEYLGVTRKGDDEDFIPAELEHTPANIAVYFNTARYYEDASEFDRAAADYRHVLELNPNRIDAHNRLASIYFRQKRSDHALAEVKLIIKLLQAQAGNKTPASFVGDYAATVAGLSSRKQLSPFMPDFMDVLRTYVKTNGDYSLLELVRSTYPATAAQRDATAFAQELSNAQKWRTSFLRGLLAPNANIRVDHEQIYRARLDSAQADMESTEGLLRESHFSELQRIQLQWLQYLLTGHQLDRLRDQLNALPQANREAMRDSLTPIQIKLAAQTGTLDLLISSYNSDSEHAPSAELLRKTATELSQSGDKQSARKLLEFVFAREVENHNLTAPNMIGLAEIRIQSGDLAGGISLLKRMALVVGNPFETQDPAASMLVRTGHPAEAVSFLEDLVRAVPWNADYRVRLAQARIAAKLNADAGRKDLATVASSSSVPYETRVNAASALAGSSSLATSKLGSKELDLIAGAQAITAADANQPFFFAARLKAAEALPEATKVSLLRAALEDNPSGDSARVPLLKAAFQAGDYYLVIATVKPQMQSNTFETAYARRYNIDSDSDEDELLNPDAQEHQAALHGFDKLPAKEWAEISRDVGIAFQKTGELPQALVYLRRAYRLEKDPAMKAQINKAVQQVRAAQRTNAANLARQPLIHSALEQEHVVRPRTGAATPPKPTKPAVKGTI